MSHGSQHSQQLGEEAWKWDLSGPDSILFADSFCTILGSYHDDCPYLTNRETETQRSEICWPGSPARKWKRQNLNLDSSPSK